MLKRVSDEVYVAPQIKASELTDLAAQGFRSIVCNRPDGEGPDQPAAAEVAAAAELQGLAFANVPVVSGQIDEGNVADFRAALARLPAPVLAYCRSGTRSQNLWVLSHR